MRKSRRHKFRQAYNAQAVVDEDDGRLALTQTATQSASDAPDFQASIDALCAEVGLPETVLTGAGYANEKAVRALPARDIEALAAFGRPEQQRRYDFRQERKKAGPPGEPKAAWL